MAAFSPEIQRSVREVLLEIFDQSKSLSSENPVRGRLRRSAAQFAASVGRGAAFASASAFRAGAESLGLLRRLERAGEVDPLRCRILAQRLQAILDKIYREERDA